MAAPLRFTHTGRMDAADCQNICRHFVNGSCRFGSSCLFRHELPLPPSSQMCRYFQKGTCWYGERCRFVHVLRPEVYGLAADRRGSVPSVLSSSSVAYSPDRRGSEPALRRSGGHSTSETTLNISRPLRDGGLLTANSNEEQAREADLDSGQRSEVMQHGASKERKQEPSSSETMEDGAAAAAAAAASGAADGAGAAAAAAASPASTAQSKADVAQAFLLSRDVTCGICMEKVYEKPDPRNQVFGILPNCNHSYCLKCIKTWRKTKDLGLELVKTCPQCRVSSAFYVPNKYWVEGRAKESLIAAFKEKFSKKTCVYYTRHGYCPFKTDCLHRHDKPRSPRLPLFTDDDDEDDDSDCDGVDLISFFIAMTLLGLDEDDFEWPFFIAEEESSFSEH